MEKLTKSLTFLKEINSLGYEAYLVGGAVRDYLLERSINDIDITTNAPIELINEKYNVNSTHASKFLGTKLSYAGLELEITHFRRDASYLDYRHPVVVKVDSLSYDLKRRDFTINALAMDSSLRIYDNYGGLRDLDLRCLRAIGRANRRFNEDPLRILRGIYFALKLSFKLEAKTKRAMLKRMDLLNKLQTLTVLNELLKIFSLENNKTFSLLSDLGLAKHLVYLRKPLYYFKRDNYYPKDLFSLIYLIDFYNGYQLNLNIKKEYKKIISGVLSLKVNRNIGVKEALDLMKKVK